MPTDLSQLPPPPKGQVGISPTKISSLPPPPKQGGGLTLQQVIAQQQPQKPSSPAADIVASTATDYSKAVPNFVAEAGKTGTPDVNKNPIIKTVENAGASTASALGTLFSPLTNTIKSISDSFASGAKDPLNPNQPIYKNPTVSKILDTLNSLSDFIGKGAQAHPELARNLNSLQTIAMAGLGGEEGTVDKSIGSVEGIKSGASDAAKGAKEIFTGSPEGKIAKTDAFVKDLVSPQQTIGKNGTLTQAIKSGRVEEGGLLSGRTVDSTAHQVAVENAVKSVPEVTPKNTLLQNSNAIHDAIGTTADTLRSDLTNREVQPLVTQSHWNNFIEKVKSDIAENPTIVGDAETTANKIINKFQSLLPKGDITATDVLDARQGLDNWMKSMKGGNVFDPKMENAVSTALRAVRQGANDLLEGTAPDVSVKDMLRKQSLLYDAVENIAPKAAKEAGSGVKRFIQNHPIIGRVVKLGIAGEAIKHLLP